MRHARVADQEDGVQKKQPYVATPEQLGLLEASVAPPYQCTGGALSATPAQPKRNAVVHAKYMHGFVLEPK